MSPDESSFHPSPKLPGPRQGELGQNVRVGSHSRQIASSSFARAAQSCTFSLRIFSSRSNHFAAPMHSLSPHQSAIDA